MWRQFIQLAIICAGITSVYSDTNYRLNTTIIPSAYSISITPYFNTGDEREFTFDGEVTITFVSEANINRIKLHSEDLIYTASNITLTNGQTTVNLDPTNPLEFDLNYTFAYINLENEIAANVEYNLNIVYQGPIRTDLYGFYRNYYIENGVKKWLGATQMESTHARKVFPSFDEPELKAVFTLTIDRPATYSPSLANTKLQSSQTLANGYIRETFYPTPKMSTYLVAFLVSEFEAGESINVGTNEFGVYSRPQAKNQSAYAFDFGRRVVQALGDYFGIDYYSTDSNLKLDHIALPDFKAGAMENWGLVKYRESLLMYVPEESTPYFKYRVAQIVAHETTHMWFGNLVTCHWWSNTWLNEGFANYFQDYITASIEPEVAAEDMLVIGSVYAAYDADDKPDSPPISNINVNSPEEISGHFGTITYQKAGSVIRMMHYLMGNDAFKSGLNAYLTANKFDSGYPDKLYTSLNSGAASYNSMANYDGLDLPSVMSPWITQAGYPILHVEVNHDDSSIVLTQKRFYIDSTQSSEELYPIPITYTLDTGFNFENTKPAFIMSNKTYVLPVREIKESDSTPIFNIQESGLYRVNYDSHTWSHISGLLKSSHEEIHYLNRAKIVNDLFAFLYADEAKFELLNDVLLFLQSETEYAVWYAAVRGLNKLRNHYLGSDTLPLIEEFALKLMNNAISYLGYEVRQSDDFKTLRSRMLILEFACKIGHQKCLEETLTIYENFKNNGAWIHPSLRSVAYCSGLRFGNGGDFDFLWNRLSTTNVANEAWIIGDILGCTNDKNKLNSYLVSMLVENSPIRTQDLTVPLSSVLSNYSHVDVVLEALQQNVPLWKTIYSTSFDSVLSTVASALHTQEEFNQFENWLSSCTECGEEAVTTARKALTKARDVTTWADNHRNDIWTSLRGDARTLSASSVLLLSIVITLFNGF